MMNIIEVEERSRMFSSFAMPLLFLVIFGIVLLSIAAWSFSKQE